jgi:hypothetical protein
MPEYIFLLKRIFGINLLRPELLQPVTVEVVNKMSEDSI